MRLLKSNDYDGSFEINQLTKSNKEEKVRVEKKTEKDVNKQGQIFDHPSSDTFESCVEVDLEQPQDSNVEPIQQKDKPSTSNEKDEDAAQSINNDAADSKIDDE